MSAAAVALEDPKPTYGELEQKIHELTGLLHVAFVSICKLECERDAAVYREETASANAACMREVRKHGLLAVMQRYMNAGPEHPLVAAAVSKARHRREERRLFE